MKRQQEKLRVLLVTRDWQVGGREDRLEEVERSDGRGLDVSPGGSSSLKYEEEPFFLLYVRSSSCWSSSFLTFCSSCLLCFFNLILLLQFFSSFSFNFLLLFSLLQNFLFFIVKRHLTFWCPEVQYKNQINRRI